MKGMFRLMNIDTIIKSLSKIVTFLDEPYITGSHYAKFAPSLN